MNEKAIKPFDMAKLINSHKERVDVEETGYEAFVINKIFSNTPDSIFFANEMNQCHSLPKQMQYDFYRFGLPKNPRRFGTWNKKNNDDAEDLKVIMEAFDMSRNKALEVLPILKPQMEKVRAAVNKGGRV